ncbi:MAG TPA: hypothetical protein VM869_09270, partial [Enhygromyxa sp.]|nr:hypothetical protein [Enhygromyxa sp.]
LEALKQKMALGSGSSGPQKAIGSAARDGDDGPEASPDIDDLEVGEDDLRAAEVDAQLEELKRKLSST